MFRDFKFLCHKCLRVPNRDHWKTQTLLLQPSSRALAQLLWRHVTSHCGSRTLGHAHSPQVCCVFRALQPPKTHTQDGKLMLTACLHFWGSSSCHMWSTICKIILNIQHYETGNVLNPRNINLYSSRFSTVKSFDRTLDIMLWENVFKIMFGNIFTCWWSGKMWKQKEGAIINLIWAKCEKSVS